MSINDKTPVQLKTVVVGVIDIDLGHALLELCSRHDFPNILQNKVPFLDGKEALDAIACKLEKSKR